MLTTVQLIAAIKANLIAVMNDFFDGQYDRAGDFDKIASLLVSQYEEHGDHDDLYEIMQWAIDTHFDSSDRNSPRYWYHSTTNERLCDVALATMHKHGLLQPRTWRSSDPDSWWWDIPLPA